MVWRVAILEDDEAIRNDFAAILVADPALEPAGAWGDLAAAQTLFDAPPDVLLADIMLPDGRSYDLIARLRAETATRIIVISVLGDEQAVVTALSAGAHAYLLKGATGFELNEAISAVMSGNTPLSPAIARYLIGQFRRAPVAGPQLPVPRLSGRESDILQQLAGGATYKEIARELEISPYTVNDHIKSVFRKLSVHTRAAAVAEGLRHGVIDLPAAGR